MPLPVAWTSMARALKVGRSTFFGLVSIAHQHKLPTILAHTRSGLLTVVVGIIFYFVVPDNQLNARFLSKPDQILAIERIRKNQQGVGNKHYKIYQLREALTDPLSWMFFFYSLVANIPNGKL